MDKLGVECTLGGVPSKKESDSEPDEPCNYPLSIHKIDINDCALAKPKASNVANVKFKNLKPSVDADNHSICQCSDEGKIEQSLLRPVNFLGIKSECKFNCHSCTKLQMPLLRDFDNYEIARKPLVQVKNADILLRLKGSDMVHLKYIADLIPCEMKNMLNPVVVLERIRLPEIHGNVKKPLVQIEKVETNNIALTSKRPENMFPKHLVDIIPHNLKNELLNPVVVLKRLSLPKIQANIDRTNTSPNSFDDNEDGIRMDEENDHLLESMRGDVAFASDTGIGPEVSSSGAKDNLVVSKRSGLNVISVGHADVNEPISGKANNNISGPLRSKECGRTFERKFGLIRKQVISHCEGNTFSSEIYSKSSHDEFQCKNQIKSHSKKRKYFCGDCGKQYTWKDGLSKHIKFVHLKLFTPLICDDCGKSFARKEHFKKHSVVHTKVKNFLCETCGSSFTDKASLVRHMILHTGEKPFKCGECGMAFSHNSNLYHHTKRHFAKEHFGCEHCGKSMSSKDGLMKHIMLHERAETYNCGECSKMFFSRDNLRNHFKQHTKEREYICNDCGKICNNKSALTEHTKVHTNIFAFKCNYCPKLFRRSSGLLVHKRIHTGEKRYCCETCGKRFVQSHSLHSHKLVHTKERPFKCTECQKGYSHKYYLQAHMRTHSGDYLKCGVCDVLFIYKFDLKRHIESKHNIK